MTICRHTGCKRSLSPCNRTGRCHEHQLTGAGTFRSRVIFYLSEGYGVEDIALMIEVDASKVRENVKHLRADGVFKELWQS